jgi:hypothetical protein
MPDSIKFLIVTIDGLRPDMVTPEIMPNLTRFKTQCCEYSAGRTVYPTQTRVNAAALATGAPPAIHGIVANRYYDPHVFRDQLFDTSNFSHIDAGQVAYNGRLVTAESFGDAAAKRGLKVAVVSTGSGGSTRMINPRAKKLGHVSLCLKAWESSTPADFADDVLKSFGPIPPATRPNSARTELQTDMFLDYVFPVIEPDVSVLWYTDPDSTFHFYGVGSPESLEAIRNVDIQFGRILDWWRGSELQEQLQLIVISDHGHITARQTVAVKDAMAEAHLRFDTHFSGDAIFAGHAGYTGAIWVRDDDQRRKAAMVEWLLEQPWCGVILTSGGNGIEGAIPGTFDRSLLMADHARAPQIYYTMRSDNGKNAHGMTGESYHDGKNPDGGSIHGGLHPKELASLLVVQGTCFRSCLLCDHPAGIVDIAPTMLHLLDIPQPASMQGRVLSEALIKSDCETPQPEWHKYSVGSSPRRQHLQTSRVGSCLYLDAAWVE